MIDLVWGLDLSLYHYTADLICIKIKRMPPDHKRSIRMHVSLSTCDPLSRSQSEDTTPPRHTSAVLLLFLAAVTTGPASLHPRLCI